MLDAVPPGQQATSTTPTAKLLGKLKALDARNPKRGITVYCSKQPRDTSLYRYRACRTSSKVSVRPIPSIVVLKPNTNGVPLNQLNSRGFQSATEQAKTTHKGKRSVITVSGDPEGEGEGEPASSAKHLLL
jgi:hypothetical protein